MRYDVCSNAVLKDFPRAPFLGEVLPVDFMLIEHSIQRYVANTPYKFCLALIVGLLDFTSERSIFLTSGLVPSQPSATASRPRYHH
jgi:hypothetical protein